TSCSFIERHNPAQTEHQDSAKTERKTAHVASFSSRGLWSPVATQYTPTRTRHADLMLVHMRSRRRWDWINGLGRFAAGNETGGGCCESVPARSRARWLETDAFDVEIVDYH